MEQKSETEVVIKLKMRQELFCKHITNISADTFDNGTKSVVAAKFKTKHPGQYASQLLKNYRIKARIRQLYREYIDLAGLTAEAVIANIRYDRQLARKAGNLNAAVACDKLEGQILALFTERTVVKDDSTQTFQDMSEIEKQAAREAARIYNNIVGRDELPEQLNDFDDGRN